MTTRRGLIKDCSEFVGIRRVFVVVVVVVVVWASKRIVSGNEQRQIDGRGIHPRPSTLKRAENKSTEASPPKV